MIKRRKTKKIKIGQLAIGGDSPILVQTMCNTDTKNIDSTILQIKKLQNAGCEIVRIAVPDKESAQAIRSIKKSINIPLVADIHFNYKLALLAVKFGADKIRINPGNIGSKKNIKEIVKACKEKNVPIRIGVNMGSLDEEIKNKHGQTARAMVENAIFNVKILENLNFDKIVLSLKAPDILRTVDAYRMISKKIDYPLHIGITEAGTLQSGIIKSAAGLGILLQEGIGDTIRVSLSADPVEEVRCSWEILKALNLRQRGVQIISCPTCGRTKVDLIKLVNQVEKAIVNIDKPIKIAIMGCAVNGPGEAKNADIGLVGSSYQYILFKKGEIIRTIPENDALKILVDEIKKI